MDSISQNEVFTEMSGMIKPFYSKIIIALIIILLGLILGRLAGRMIYRVLSELEINKIIKKTTGLTFRLDKFLGSSASFVIIFIFGLWGLEYLGLSSIVLNFIAGAFIVILVIAIFLGVKDLIPNLIGGIYIHRKELFKEGDKIKIDNVSGEVLQINLTETKIMKKRILRSDDILYVPNSMFIKPNVLSVTKKKK